MTTNYTRKIGRKAVGSWGRPTGKYQKRLAAKAIRRYRKLEA